MTKILEMVYRSAKITIPEMAKKVVVLHHKSSIESSQFKHENIKLYFTHIFHHYYCWLS